jgi:Uma2 family endonuclease
VKRIFIRAVRDNVIVQAAVMAAKTLNRDNEILLELFLKLDTPEGLWAELIEGEIVVSSVPEGSHEHVWSEAIRQFALRSKTEMDFSSRIGLELPPLGPHPANHLIPDLTLVPSHPHGFKGESPWMDPTAVALVGEITGPRPERDRNDKRRCYAQGGIPCYLLIDRQSRTVVLHRDPLDGDYADAHSRAFGKPVPLPEPFGFELDTSDFV